MESTAQPTGQCGLGAGNQAAAQPDAQELTGSQKLGMAMGTGQWKMQQEQQGGDGKKREDQGKSLGAMQSTKTGAFSKGCANSGAHTRPRSSWELASRSEKKRTVKTGASICPVSLLTLLACQKSHDEASALQGHENI